MVVFIHPKHNLIYECKVCHQTFKDSQGVYRHVMLHSETEFFRHLFCTHTILDFYTLGFV